MCEKCVLKRLIRFKCAYMPLSSFKKETVKSFAGSKVICVENKYIPCLCTHFLLIAGNTDSTW